MGIYWSSITVPLRVLPKVYFKVATSCLKLKFIRAP